MRGLAAWALLAVPLVAQGDLGDRFAEVRPSYGPKTSRALGLYRARRYAEAMRALGAPSDEAGRLLEARALFDLGHFRDAAERFRALAAANPLLADHYRAHGARALLNAGDPAAAAREADVVADDTPARAAALLTGAEAHLTLGRPAEARRRAEEFVKRWPEKPSAANALWVLARAASALGDEAAARAARRRIYVEYPASFLADRLGRMPLRPALALARADRLVKLHRNARATQELLELRGRPGLSRDLRCRLSYLLGAAFQRRRIHRRAFAELRQAARLCTRADLAARALYLWGKGLLSGRSPARAARVLEELARRFPGHRLADDALLLAAQGWRRAGELGHARAALTRLLRETPQGDMVWQGRFDLAELDAREGRLDEAARRLEEMARDLPYPEDESLRGRPLYALGQVRERQGQRALAVLAYRRCHQEHPLTYWGALARGRLRALGQAFDDPLAGALPRARSPEALPWPGLPEALTSSRAFQRGAALIRLGAGDLAAPEISLAARAAGRTEEVRTALALLHHLAGDWYRSHRIVRWEMAETLARPPSPQSWRHFLLGYPRGFAEVLDPIARGFGIDPLLLTALVREESAFNPVIESWANAVGLGQLILPTARRLARALRIRNFSREMLFDPEVNLKLGASYLASLLRRFRGEVPLAIAAYNAGELAVERWLRERGGLDLDRFVESIPYEQTRLYTKRVLQSYAVYRYLYGEDERRLLTLGPGHERQRRR
jgi:soluble lytic murein transglycosylase